MLSRVSAALLSFLVPIAVVAKKTRSSQGTSHEPPLEESSPPAEPSILQPPGVVKKLRGYSENAMVQKQSKSKKGVIIDRIEQIIRKEKR